MAAASLLAAAAAGGRYYRQQAVLDALQAEVTAATGKAKAVQERMDRRRQAEALPLRLRGKREEPGLIDIWEETTRILPAHTWLTEIRLSETPGRRDVVMTGLSAGAASLVGLLDRSALLEEASIVGPVTVDPAEGRERFVIKARVRPPPSPKGGPP